MEKSQVLNHLFSDFKTFLWKKRFYFAIGFAIFYSIFSVLEPFLFSNLLKLVEDFYKSWNFVLQDFIRIFSIWWLFIFFLTFISYFYRYHIIDKNALNFYNESYKKYADKILHMTYETYLSKKQWEIYKKFDKWIEIIFRLPFFFFREILWVFTGIIFALIILAILNIQMFFVMALMIPLILWLGYFFHIKTWEKQKKLEDEYNEVGGILVDSTTNFWLLKTLWLEKKFSNLVKERYDDILSRQLKVSKNWAIADIYTTIIVTIERFLVLWVWIYFLFEGKINLWELFLYFTFIAWIYFPLGRLFSTLRDLQKQMAILNNFYSELDNLEGEKLYTGEKIEKLSGKIEFKNVSFSYKDWKKDVLKNINFTIKKWEKVAFVGNTWAGKSTIVSLLFRLWDISSWKILLDNHSIEDISKYDIRRHIGIVMQDNSLFNTSILDNLKYAKKDASKKEIDEALKKAKADFVFTLEKWVDTIIWERWLKLSGWEKQRLNIARLFLKNPEILILDEATSALDNKTEMEVQAALNNLMKWRTSIIIAHRLSTIKHVDTIFMLENGEIIESWSYEELIKNKKKFYSLANPEDFII